MPTYEYQCKTCGKHLERLQKITDEPLKDCPFCSAKGSLQRGFGGGIGLSFQGSGFYATDYANPSPPKSEEAPKKECCPCGKNKGSCGSSQS